MEEFLLHLRLKILSQLIALMISMDWIYRDSHTIDKQELVHSESHSTSKVTQYRLRAFPTKAELTKDEQTSKDTTLALPKKKIRPILVDDAVRQQLSFHSSQVTTPHQASSTMTDQRMLDAHTKEAAKLLSNDKFDVLNDIQFDGDVETADVKLEDSQTKKSCGLYIIDNVQTLKVFTTVNGYGFTCSQPENKAAMKLFSLATVHLKKLVDQKTANNQNKTVPAKDSMKAAVQQYNDKLCVANGLTPPKVSDRHMKVYSAMIEGFNPHHESHVQGEANLPILTILNEYARIRLGDAGYESYSTDLQAMFKVLRQFYDKLNTDTNANPERPVLWAAAALELIQGYMKVLKMTPITHSFDPALDAQLEQLRPTFCKVINKTTFGNRIEYCVETRPAVIEQLGKIRQLYETAATTVNANASDTDIASSPSKKVRLSGGFSGAKRV